MRAIRKAEDASRLEKKSTEIQKAKLYRILDSNDFARRLEGGPNQRARTQSQLLKRLDGAGSVQKFLESCEPSIQKTIEKLIQL